MLGGLDFHSIAVAVKRAMTALGLPTTAQALVDAATIQWDATLGTVATVTLGGNRTFAAPTGLRAGSRYVLHITEDGTGGRSVTWNAVFKGHGGQAMTAVQPIPTIGATSSFTFESPDGVNLNLIWSRIGNMQVFTASGTYTPTAGMRWVKSTLVAGGASGGGSTANGAGACSAGTGGAAGGTSIKVISAATIGASQTVTIGAKGATSGAGAGGNPGGTTSLGAIHSATGGAPGQAGGSTAQIQCTEGAVEPAGGVGVSGDINITGGAGRVGFQFMTANRAVGGGGGNSTHGGGAGSSVNGAGTASAATAYGAAGSGAAGLGTEGAKAGGAGTDGICIIEEFF